MVGRPSDLAGHIRFPCGDPPGGQAQGLGWRPQVAPCCGYVAREDPDDPPAALVEALAGMPVWAFHSADDSVVDVAHTDAMDKVSGTAGRLASALAVNAFTSSE